MSTVLGVSRNERPGSTTATSTEDGVNVGGASAPPTLLITPYVAAVHRRHPSASVGPDAISAPSWVTRTRAPAMGVDPSDTVRTWRKFFTVRADRWSVRFTAPSGRSLFNETTWEMLVRRTAVREFANVEFTTVTVLFPVNRSAALFRREAPDTVTFTES